ncbi:MAG: M23 family metallopeptidase [Sandaracinaceae bacterium]|nr:M23 family metallopeptidase [Sandaracinaceae bacterium]
MSEPSDDGVVKHRPLPSVGIPLLRDEVRASRVRRIVGASVVGVGLLGALISVLVSPELWGLGGSAADSVDEPPVAADPPPLHELDEPEADLDDLDAPPVEELPAEEPLGDGEGTRVVRPFGTSPGFRPALVAAGCTGAEADQLISALDGVMDFRRCRPSHEMVIERDLDGHLSRFEYRASTTQIYEARRTVEGTLVGSQVEVPIERVRLRRGGTIQSSLGTALEAAGLGRTLVGVFVETFEREVNFNTQTRAGDTFRIIVDEERVGGELLRYGTVHAIEVRGQRVGAHRAFWFETSPDHGDFFDSTGRAVHGGWLRTPLRYDHLSSGFDPRRMHPILRRIVPHNGVDYAAGTGTPVWAAADGVVTFVGPRGANGNLVSLRHENGYETHYAHLSRFASGLARDARVEQRQIIGYVGSTGRSTGPHLHFGLKRNGRFVDPQAELNGPGRMMGAAHLGRFRRQVRDLERELDAIELPSTPAVDSAPEAPSEAAPAATADGEPTD